MKPAAAQYRRRKGTFQDRLERHRQRESVELKKRAERLKRFGYTSPEDPIPKKKKTKRQDHQDEESYYASQPADDESPPRYDDQQDKNPLEY